MFRLSLSGPRVVDALDIQQVDILDVRRITVKPDSQRRTSLSLYS